MDEKLKHRSVWLLQSDSDTASAESAAVLLREVEGILRVRVAGASRLIVGYDVRQITFQIIEELLQEFGYTLRTGYFCRFMRAICYYVEDIECTSCKHDQADCTRDAFITRYLRRKHGCRDHRPEYLRRYL